MRGNFDLIYTGEVQTIQLPLSVKYIKIDAYGASGGGYGGKGGRVCGKYIFKANDSRLLNIYVGGSNGYNGGVGYSPYTNNGGGATDVRINGSALTDRIIVAGGGGGGSNVPGGAGGGLIGEQGYTDGDGYSTDIGGSGGTQMEGGLGGTSSGAGSFFVQGVPGSLGYGGSGSLTHGGGGGYYGGGSGSAGTNGRCSGGGGGSSYIALLDPQTALTTTGLNVGNGKINISYGHDMLILKDDKLYSLDPANYSIDTDDILPVAIRQNLTGELLDTKGFKTAKLNEIIIKDNVEINVVKRFKSFKIVTIS